MRHRTPQRFPLGHHPIPPINPNTEAITLHRRPKRRGLPSHLITHTRNKIVQPPNQQRIARPANADRSVSGKLDTLQLHRIPGSWIPSHSGNPHRPIADRIETTFGSIQHPPRFNMMNGTAVLMQRVIGDRQRRAAPRRIGRLALNMIVTHRHEQAVMPFRDRRRRPAFQHLPRIPGRRRRQPRPHRSRRP